MEAIVVLGLAIGLAWASVRWGADSRPRVRAKELDQALWGMSWGPGAAPPPAPIGLPERSALEIAQRVRRAERARYQAA